MPHYNIGMSTRHLITTSGAARILEQSEGTVRRLENKGEITAIKTERGMRLFDRAAIERVAAERKARRGDNEAA
jgi:excisionase family DNA binding protein